MFNNKVIIESVFFVDFIFSDPLPDNFSWDTATDNEASDQLELVHTQLYKLI